jgi:hypothetical protein
VSCHELELMIEGIADGSHQPDPIQLAHLASCRSCAAQLAAARTIEQWLPLREVPAPSTMFTANVLARIAREHWQTERVVDLGFNLAIAAGLLIIAGFGAALAWSLGLLSITIDVEAIWQAFGTEMNGRVLSQLQTMAMAAALLTTTLVRWWWAETSSE